MWKGEGLWVWLWDAMMAPAHRTRKYSNKGIKVSPRQQNIYCILFQAILLFVLPCNSHMRSGRVHCYGMHCLAGCKSAKKTPVDTFLC